MSAGGVVSSRMNKHNINGGKKDPGFNRSLLQFLLVSLVETSERM